jgi:hypothetical protein
MSSEARATLADVKPGRNRKASRLFRVVIGRFGDAADRATMDELARWVEGHFAADLQRRPSKHLYLRTLPEDIIRRIDRLRDNPIIHAAILEQFEPGSVITPMKHTDELYISHYNRDFGGDHGLFGKHYDGNLRFVPYGSVVRALIYLQSDDKYKLVFADSKVEKAFTTYEFGLLDFHRELHWVEGEYKPSDQQRILLKCNYLICPGNAGVLKRALLDVNTGVFYVVKAAMEYSKSPKTPLQYVIGFFCNLFRLMNNVHPFIPLAFLVLVFALVVWGFLRLVT